MTLSDLQKLINAAQARKAHRKNAGLVHTFDCGRDGAVNDCDGHVFCGRLFLFPRGDYVSNSLRAARGDCCIVLLELRFMLRRIEKGIREIKTKL